MRCGLWFPLLILSGGAAAQEIVEVPASQANVPRPDDLYGLPPGQWHFAKQLWEGSQLCTPQQCEAGYTSDDLVVSVEHSGDFVRVIAALRNCVGTAYSELEVGDRPSKSRRKRVASQVQRVVKGLGKNCNTTPPAVAPLKTELLFPASG